MALEQEKSGSINRQEYICANTSRAALYEQLAEECSEMAQAALKVSRNLRGENESRVPMEIAMRDTELEYTDVVLCARLLGLQPDSRIYNKKLDRWVTYLRSKKLK